MATVANDFEDGPLKDLGVEVTRIPVTVTTNFSGQKTYSDGQSVSITVVFMNPNQNFALDKSGLTEICDAKMFTKSTETINKYDKIIFNNKTYRVDRVNERKFDGVTAFKSVLLFLV